MRFTPRRRWVVVVGLLNALAVAGLLIRIGGDHATDHLDLQVYRIGASVWMHNHALYGVIPITPDGVSLPFTYPPISAILFTPFALLSLPIAGAVITLLNISLLAVVLYRVFLTLKPSSDRRQLMWWIAAMLPIALFLEPVRSTINYGQVNLALMALVTFDCLGTAKRWPRGVLVGLAAAMKLTPIVFVLFFLLSRDFRSAIRAGLSFIVVTGIGFALAWHDSLTYWGTTVWNASRVGPIAYVGNQSINAMLSRYSMPTHVRSALYVLLCLLALSLAVIAIRRAFDTGSRTLALLFNALLGLLVSPISWSHHWVWLVPGVVSLWIVGRETKARLAIGLAAVGGVLIAICPQWWLPYGANRELHWALWEQMVGSNYVLYAFVVLGTAAFSRKLWRHTPMQAWLQDAVVEARQPDEEYTAEFEDAFARAKATMRLGTSR